MRDANKPRLTLDSLLSGRTYRDGLPEPIGLLNGVEVFPPEAIEPDRPVTLYLSISDREFIEGLAAKFLYDLPPESERSNESPRYLPAIIEALGELGDRKPALEEFPDPNENGILYFLRAYSYVSRYAGGNVEYFRVYATSDTGAIVPFGETLPEVFPELSETDRRAFEKIAGKVYESRDEGAKAIASIRRRFDKYA